MYEGPYMIYTNFNKLFICCYCFGPAGGASSYNCDISEKSDLTKLYNSPVCLAERMRRPLENLSFKIGIVSHSGVVLVPLFIYKNLLPVLMGHTFTKRVNLTVYSDVNNITKCGQMEQIASLIII